MTVSIVQGEIQNPLLPRGQPCRSVEEIEGDLHDPLTVGVQECVSTALYSPADDER